MIFVAVLYLIPSGLLALCLAATHVWDRVRDRRADGDCAPYGGKLVYSPLPTLAAGELERLRSGAALAEAMLLQLREIKALPETPAGRSTWS